MKRFLCVLGLAAVLGGCGSDPTLTFAELVELAEHGDNKRMQPTACP